MTAERANLAGAPMSHIATLALVALALPLVGLAQQPGEPLLSSTGGALRPPADAVPKTPAKPGAEGTMAPTWETQRQARTYLLSIPAPRGQIVDRNGEPLAQTRVSYNLAVSFPTPLEMRDAEVGLFVQRQASLAQ